MSLVTAETTKGALQYSVIDLGSFGGDSYARDINNRGEIVGYAYSVADLNYHAFLYQNGVMMDLGTFGGGQSFAYGINDNGQIVGYASPTASTSFAFLHQGAKPLDPSADSIGSLGGGFSIASGISENGQVVGSSGHAFLYVSGIMHDLGTFDRTTSAAFAVNNNGQIVGAAHVDIGITHAFLHQGREPLNGLVDDLGTLGGDNSAAIAINEIGQVVGRSDIDGNIAWHAFLYSGSSMRDLGTLPGGTISEANGINNKGDIVGRSTTNNDARPRAFVSFGGGQIQDLNSLIPADSGWVLASATSINDAGQIVGYGFNARGEEHAFLLTPVPEPAAFVVWSVLGSVVLAVCCRRLPQFSK